MNIDRIDAFFTELFEKWQDIISFRTIAILFVGILIGFAICSSIYGILLIKSVRQEEEKCQKTRSTTSMENEEKINQVVNQIKNKYLETSVGLSVKNRFEILGSKLYQTMQEIASIYYPQSKYPLYELTIEEFILFIHYLSNRIDGVFEKPILKPFKKLSISKIFTILDTKKRIEESKAVKFAKTTKLGKVKRLVLSIVSIMNPIHWLKKLVVSSTIDIAMKKVALLMIDIVADETTKTYSKSIFDKEKNLRQLEIEKVLEDLEKEEMNV